MSSPKPQDEDGTLPSGVRTRRQPRKNYAVMNGDSDDDDDSDVDEPDDLGSTNYEVKAPPCNGTQKKDTRVFRCVLCLSDADDTRSHLAHMRTAHPNHRTHCLICETEYDTYGAYKRHLRDDHPDMLRRLEERSSSESGLYCLECGKPFASASFLHRHRSQHFMLNREECKECGKSFLEGPAMERHLMTHRTVELSCGRCDVTFQDSRSLKNHARKHRQYKYHCRVCGRPCRTAMAVETHMCRRHPQPGNSYRCSLCQKHCNSTNHLCKHIAAKHRDNGERLFTCDICKRSFRWKHTLKAHTILHHPTVNGEGTPTLHKCPHCDVAFPYRFALQSHLIKHSERRDFHCKLCGMAFKRKQPLTDHMKAVHCSEKKFHCTTCGQMFAVKRYLDAHCRLAHPTHVEVFPCK
ncbi:zinc finger protein 99 [Ixodes scapularis]